MPATMRTVVKPISMYPSDWRVVEAFARLNGQGRSAALRQIVRGYVRLEEEKEAARALRKEEARDA